MAAGGGDKAVVDTAAMNSFIQELRHLSNSSTISSISSTSTDSGISTSHYGDSNVGSGLAAAIINSHLQQTTSNTAALIQQSNGKASTGMVISSGAVPKTGISTPPGLSTAAIWGNKSLWGPAPPSPSLTLPETTPASALVSPPVMKSSTILPAAVTSPTSNALYTSLSKEMYSPWSTSTPTATATGPTPAGENNRNVSLPTQSQLLLATKSSNTTITSILSNTSTSIISTDNNGTNIWDSKLGLFGTQQSPTVLGSKWPAREPASASESALGSEAGGATDALSNNNVWSVHTAAASSGSSSNQRAISYAAVGSQYALPQVSMSSSITGGVSIDNGSSTETMNFTPKHLSALWSNAQTSSSVEGAESNMSVFKSMRLGDGATPLFDFSSTDGRTIQGGNSKGVELVGPIGENKLGAASNDSTAVTLFSDEFMSYLNVFN